MNEQTANNAADSPAFVETQESIDQNKKVSEAWAKENQPQQSNTAQQAEVKKEEKPKKVFTRNDVKRSIELNIVFPKIYPEYEPWGFKMRLKLSKEAEERRQTYLSLAASEQTASEFEQALDEVCDLLVEMPTGFGDLLATGKGPGDSFRNYVKTATDTDMKDFLAMVVTAADSAYWGAITPREFRKPL